MDEPIAKPEATHSDIQEILRKRREMLNRVRADLDKVGKLQEEFREDVQKRLEQEKAGK